MHPNDRCTIVAEFDDDVVDGLQRKSRDEDGNSILVPQNMTYQQWYDKYVTNNNNILQNNKNNVNIEKIGEKEEKQLQYIGKIDKNKIGKYKDIAITDEVILTNERLNEHILKYHKNEYEQLRPYMKDIIENPDFILDDNRNENTIILLKQISEIKKNGRMVIKIAVAEDVKHPKNSIITLMKLNDRTWKQTIKNRGNIIFDKNE